MPQQRHRKGRAKARRDKGSMGQNVRRGSPEQLQGRRKGGEQEGCKGGEESDKHSWRRKKGNEGHAKKNKQKSTSRRPMTRLTVAPWIEASGAEQERRGAQPRTGTSRREGQAPQSGTSRAGTRSKMVAP